MYGHFKHFFADTEAPVLSTKNKKEPTEIGPDCDTGGLRVSSEVVVTVGKEQKYGIIRWIGHFGDTTKIRAGVEMVIFQFNLNI